jgi:3-hydroxybutyryl-CoA dehydrogenase
MNPVYAKPTVEMIRARATSESTLDRARTLLRQMGKDAIVVGDAPGFVSNRVLMLTINEAIRVVEEGIASSEDVDRLFRTCFGHKMGPLETADLIGLDTILLSLEVLAETRDRDHFAAASLLRDLVAQGRLGRKSGRGFYSYDTLPNASAAASSS